MAHPKTERRLNLCAIKIKAFCFMTVESHKVSLVISPLLVKAGLVSACISFPNCLPVGTRIKLSDVIIYLQSLRTCNEWYPCLLVIFRSNRYYSYPINKALTKTERKT